MIFFDYIFYRVYKFYFEFNESSPWVFAVAALSFSMLFVFDSIHILLKGILDSTFKIKVTGGYWIFGVILFFNIIRYTWIKPYARLEQKWGENKGDLKETIKGWLVLFYLLGSLISALYLTGFFKK
jgi:hypothetical protein